MVKWDEVKVILIDFDGVIARNSIMISIAFMENFINRFTPYKKKSLEQFYKATNSFPVAEKVELLLNSLGIADKIPLVYEESLKLDLKSYNGIEASLDPSFNPFYKHCTSRNIMCKIFTASNTEYLKKYGFNQQIDIYNNGGLSKGTLSTYTQIIKKLSIPAHQIVLIDDGPVVLATAKKAGLKTIRKKTPLFSDEDFEEYNEYIDLTINLFEDLIAMIK